MGILYNLSIRPVHTLDNGFDCIFSITPPLPPTHGRSPAIIHVHFFTTHPLILRKEGLHLHITSYIISCMHCIHTFVQPVALDPAYNIRRNNVRGSCSPRASWKRRGSLPTRLPRGWAAGNVPAHSVEATTFRNGAKALRRRGSAAPFTRSPSTGRDP